MDELKKLKREDILNLFKEIEEHIKYLESSILEEREEKEEDETRK